METNYYQQIIEEIKENIVNNSNKAMRLIENELAMPYIPQDFENELLELKKEVRSLQDTRKGIDLEGILEGLNSDDNQVQLQAIQTLSRVSCRDYIEDIQTYFNHQPHKNLQAILIDILIEQQITDEFQVTHDGVQIEFIPCFIERPQDSDGYVGASNLLSSWFESDNPSFLKMCMQVVTQEVFCMLPLSYDDQEAMILALTAVSTVSKSMDDGETFNQLIKSLNIENYVLLC